MALKAEILRESPPITSFGGCDVLFQMAADAEYGPYLRAIMKPLITGVGPVEAAIVTATALSHATMQGRRPQLVVSLGSAGSRRLEQTRVYQASSVSYRDMDASALGLPKGATPFLDLPPILPLPLRIEGVPEVSLSTGAAIVSGTAYDSIDADMVDMETFAVLRACQAFDLPLIALRGISDGAEELGHVDDWTRYLHIVDRNLAEAVLRLELDLKAGRIL